MHAVKLSEILAAKVNAVNLAHDYAVKLQKVLVPYFTSLVGQKILKADGRLTAKVEKGLPPFPATNGNPGQHKHATITTYWTAKLYTMGWNVKSCWPLPPHSCLYHETVVYLGELAGDTLKNMTMTENWVPPPAYSLPAVQATIEAYEAAKKEAGRLRNELWPFSEFVQ